MEKFGIAKNISITELDNDGEDNEYQEEDGNYEHDYDDDDVPAQYLEGYYVMYDDVLDREYLINNTIKYFIDKFSIPKTKAEVLQEIESEVKSDSTTIEELCTPFFEFLCKRKVLVPEDYEEPVIADSSLFKEGDCIRDLRYYT